MKTFIDTINFGVKNWWVSLLLGLLYILIAICLMFTPLASYVALSVLFSVSMFVSGTLEILFAVTNRKNISSWGWYLASGIIDLILGIYLMANIGLSMAVLPFIVAFWLMFRGFASTGYAMDLRNRDAILPQPHTPTLTIRSDSALSIVDEIPSVRGRYTTSQNSLR